MRERLLLATVLALTSAGCAETGIVKSAASPTCEPSVKQTDPRHDRYEGTGVDNACTSDAECVVGGCSSEVCAAEPVMTTCEAVPRPEGSCGCLEGVCVWQRCSEQ